MPLNELRAACKREGISHRQTTPGERFAAADSESAASGLPGDEDAADEARKGSSLFAYCNVGETVVVG